MYLNLEQQKNNHIFLHANNPQTFMHHTPKPIPTNKNGLSNLRYHLQQCVKGLLLHQSAMFTGSHSFPGIETTSKKTSFQIHLELLREEKKQTT